MLSKGGNIAFAGFVNALCLVILLLNRIMGFYVRSINLGGAGTIMKKTICGILLLALFGGFTYLVRTFDVAAIGPQGTEVGFSHLNQRVHDLTGVNMQWYEHTDLLGYAAIGIAALFAVAGLIQLIRRKSLFAVDREILALGLLFIVVIGLYIGFEKFIINYRPIIMPGETYPEASYPSSHTMLIVTVFGATMMLIRRYFGKGFISGLLRLVCLAVILVTVGGRLYCGVHWFTDIVGGLLLSMGLLEIFGGVISGGKRKKGAAKTAQENVSDVKAAADTGGYAPKH